MITDIIESEDYKDLVTKQIKENIELLLQKDMEFSMTVNLEGVTFNPELPDSITAQFSKFTLFVLANYTYQSIKLGEDFIEFEAGFGKENFGSVVRVPFHAVFQLIIDESILYVNTAATVDKFFQKPQDKIQNSRDIFKKNTKRKFD